MPLPPPGPTSQPAPGRRRRREIDQLQRALGERGALPHDELAEAVGAAYWDPGRFDKALAWALKHGWLREDADGRISVA
jgi:hypothetical protein